MGITAEDKPLKVSTPEHLEAKKDTIFRAFELAWTQIVTSAQGQTVRPTGFVADIRIKLADGNEIAVKPEGLFIDQPAPAPVEVKAEVAASATATA